MSQKALVVEKLNAPVVLTERPIPKVSEGELLIKVEVAGFNPHDTYAHQFGLFIGKSLPSPLAIDIVGTVAELGPGVKDFTTGERVYYLGVPTTADGNGTQEYVLAKAEYTGKAPDGISSDDIATMILNPYTAFTALFQKQGLGLPPPFSDEAKTFDWAAVALLVIGGGSACGKYAVQWAKYVGIGTVIVVASKGKSEQDLKKLGATHVIDRHGSNDEINDEVRSIVGDELVYAIDCVGNGPTGQTLGAKALSNSKKGTLAALIQVGQVDETQIGEKKAGYTRHPISAGIYSQPEVTAQYFQMVALKMKDGTILPTPYSTINGLDEAKVNEVLDAYKHWKPLVKPHVHP